VSDENESVGSVAEEAVKLLGALQGWAKESLHDPADPTAGAASAFKNLNEHVATGSPDCKYCPVCQVISVVRQTSPEVKHHLSTAASSLLHAAAAALSADSTDFPQSEPLEKIDLSADGDWEDDR
jgi:hypothetical protein